MKVSVVMGSVSDFDSLKEMLDFFKEMDIDMIGMGPFIPHNDTPFANVKIESKTNFLLGLKMYTEAFYLLRENFDKIDVKLQPGNHDEATSFYLYVALAQAFQNDNIIKFSDEYKAVQVTEFGNSALFTAHGNFKGKNYKKLIQSIAFEFAEVWGRTQHRELHLGHLHTELVVDENSGLIVRRIGSPSGTDSWHYENRYVGSRKAHQLFLWHKEVGMINSHYIVFPPELESTKERAEMEIPKQRTR